MENQLSLLEEKFFTDASGNEVPISEQECYVLVREKWYAKDDERVFECDNCNEYELSIFRRNTSDTEEAICEDCYSNSYGCCESCGEIFQQDNLYYRESRGADYCEQCDPGEDDCSDDEEFDDYRVVQDYSLDVTNRLSEFGDSRLKLGIELEVEVRDSFDYSEVSRTVAEHFEDFALLKHDGSLTHGFEIVTAPADFASQQKHWEDFFTAKIEGMKSFSTETCGMHVHVTRSVLPIKIQEYLSEFINKTYNKKFIQFIAQRTEERWCKYYGNKKAATSAMRYEALNFATRDNVTIEFRIFKGNLKQESFLKNMEFVVALISFCTQKPTKLSYCHFLQFVSHHRTRFPHLWEFAKGYSKGSNFSQQEG